MSAPGTITRMAADAPPEVRPVHVRAGRLEHRLGLLAALGGFGMIALTYAPMLWLGIMSVSADPLGGLPGPFTLEWYDRLFTDRRWVGPLLASMGCGAVVGLACAASGLLVARALPQLRARGALLIAFLAPLFIPGVLLGAGLFLYLRVFLGLRLGWWSVFLAHFAWAYPFALLALLVTTTRFDTRLNDAAADLGAGPWRRFVDVEFPLIMPGVVSAALFGFLLSFNELARTILLRGTATTLPLFEWAQATSHSSNVPLIFALATLVLLASLLLIGVSFWMLFGRAADR
ncbi:ABC transporter permease subunit [Starkeya sp. 3C]|uniref:ABC transporter permease subunit n=1 Tax=Ancylobacter moscoviensis TaxID=2597768 RepID=A0ABY3DT81_9HYPH|nr:ABC transporter permease subunit [Ancylobacter moscoviensis]TSJ60987.1 ABC transporter permease subunit [Ancylobacter moscoviensis]